ncbi:peptide ABC transporter permease [Paenarthrobacter histidinolovorans]|nr:peptide ABC transporter permease [Paenarthrobacter histidinolovorans]
MSKLRKIQEGPLVWASAIVLVLAAAIAIFVPVFVDASPGTVDLTNSLRKPIWMGGSWDAPLGTDQLGRDVLLQLSLAIRISALVATVSVLLAGTIGVMLGLVSGYRGGWMDSIVNRLSETQMALPFLVVAMVLAVALGPSLTTIVVAIALSGWVPFARLVRAEALVLRNREFVLLAKVASVSSARIVLRHLLPNVLPSVVVLGTQSIAIAVLEESALSFLGLGVQPPMMSLGSMIGQTRLQLQTDAWLPLTPIIVLALLALAINILGDRFRRRLEIKK